jgi:acetylglutamate kinase
VDPALAELLMTSGYVPVLASLGIDRGAGDVLNINADVMACRLAAALGAELIIAGATPGVLDAAGATLPALSVAGMDALISDGTATAGMIAKLRACREALEGGVPAIRLVDGRGFAAGIDPLQAPGTTLTRSDVKEPAHS